MSIRGMVIGVVVGLALTGCGELSSGSSGGEPFTLPVGDTTWDDVRQPAWIYDGVLHVGSQTVEIDGEVDEFVLGATGAYWLDGQTLMFTSAEGKTEEVRNVGAANIAVSADRSVFATVDQSSGPTDEYGAHVMQVAAFDTMTGEQLYRTPDEEPAAGADLDDLYEEIMPLLYGVSTERIFYDGATISLKDGSMTPSTQDADFNETYEGYQETLFPDGYHVSMGLLSPDRSTRFENGVWPTPAVVFDAETDRKRSLKMPWKHFVLAGWSDDDTFFGVAEKFVPEKGENVLRARRIVTCETATLACTPVSPVIPVPKDPGVGPSLMIEGTWLA